MAKGKAKTSFFCQECGYESLRWQGKCPGCGAWNTFVEELTGTVKEKQRNSSLPTSKPLKLEEIVYQEHQRMDTGLAELNRVLGGGIVPGELILLSGDPGIGKSTLTMQLAGKMGAYGKVLYVSGEESGQQLKMRAERLAVRNDELKILIENNLEIVEQHLQTEQPKIVILDSIQTVYLPEISSAQGSVSQLRECTNRILQWAKIWGIAVIVVGHVTKDGSVAGPRVLEHMVDAVLFFEGDRQYQYRVLRALKNRFGSTNEIGVFEMQEQGLVEIANPSAVFLAERSQETVGSAVVACMEGSRPVLLELQALVSPSFSNQPRRMTNGADYNRVAMLLAVLEKRAGLRIGNQDIYINIAGGLRVDEPAADLGIVVALASSLSNKAVAASTVVLGEVGLTGEIRTINHLDKRLIEAAKMGFTTAIVPKGNLNNCPKTTALKIIGVEHIRDVLKVVLED